MPSKRRILALLAALLVAASPAPALAQSAGDDQYQDPFAGEAPQSQPAPAPSGGGSGSSGSPAPAPAPSTPAPEASASQDAPAPAPAPAQPAAAATGDELPRTGAEAWLLALAGAGCLVAGAGLRRASRAA